MILLSPLRLVDLAPGSDLVIALIGVLGRSRIASCRLRRLISPFNECSLSALICSTRVFRSATCCSYICETPLHESQGAQRRFLFFHFFFFFFLLSSYQFTPWVRGRFSSSSILDNSATRMLTRKSKTFLKRSHCTPSTISGKSSCIFS